MATARFTHTHLDPHPLCVHPSHLSSPFHHLVPLHPSGTCLLYQCLLYQCLLYQCLLPSGTCLLYHQTHTQYGREPLVSNMLAVTFNEASSSTCLPNHALSQLTPNPGANVAAGVLTDALTLDGQGSLLPMSTHVYPCEPLPTLHRFPSTLSFINSIAMRIRACISNILGIPYSLCGFPIPWIIQLLPV